MPKSQLAQLKSSLSQAGAIGPKQNGKKRKYSGPQEGGKAKKLNDQPNPFDIKVTKLKHEVGGRKVKGITGKPTQSKQAGIEQRKKTLLKEYEEKHHAGGIVDKRFGESDPTMSLEERMLERFTRERQRASRGAVFNLEDEDELTHYGQSLSKMDDFDDTGLGLDDDEEEETGQIDRDIVKKTHFGGFGDESDDKENDDDPARNKSKAEVMAEVIAKSKEHKLRRQMEREQEDNVRHELDQEFDSIRSLLYTPTPLPLETIPSKIDTAGPSGSADSQDYDQQVRELAFDQRAKPKDRTKTEEELALEQKEALEKAERQRQRRMMGEDDYDSDQDVGKSRRKRKKGDEDEEDMEDEIAETRGLGGSEGSDSGDEDGDEDEEDGAEEKENLIPTKTEGSKVTKKSGNADGELAFTFPCPSTHEEFMDIVEDVKDEDVPTVIQRIRTLYHPSLGPDNKLKLQALTSVMIDHILYITSPPTPRFTLLTALLPHLTSLTKSYPIQSAECFLEKLSLMHKNLKRGLSHGALDPESKTWPGLPELSLLRIIGVIWPTSDLNHAVISPTRLLMGAYLGLGRVRSLTDITSGLFLCTLFLQFEVLSKRFVPEVINFTINAVLHLAPHSYEDVASLPGSFPSPDFRSELIQPLSINLKAARKLSVQKPNLTNLLGGETQDEQAKVDLLGLALDVLRQFADMYKGLPAFIELYTPISDIINGLHTKKLTEGLQTRIMTLTDMLSRLLKFSQQSRRPLALQAHKPIPIPTYIPKFETHSSSYLRHQDPDHEKNEASKLRYQYKQERKGAIRELRKDARFLAAVEQKKQAEKDQTYNLSMKRVMGSIEGERAEQKALEREKMKEKKRSGRK